MRERESALAVAAGRTNLSELARVNSENEARSGTRENDGKKPPLIRILLPELPAEITLKPYGDPRNVMISR